MTESTGILGALRWILGADSSELEAALDRSGKRWRDFSKAAETAGKAAGNAIGQHLGRLGALAAGYVTVSRAVATFNAAISDVSAIGRLSQQTGISTERISELRFAAASVGVAFESLDQTMRGFSQRMAEGLANPSSAAALALRALGVSARDSVGDLRNFDQVLPDIAEAFSRYRDGATKAQLASALFGEEAGPRLVNLLNQGRGGIERLTDEARRLGLTISPQQVQTANDFVAAQAKLQESFSALAREITITLTPALTAAADAMSRFLNASRPRTTFADELRDINGEIANTLKHITELQASLLRVNDDAIRPVFGPNGQIWDLFGRHGAARIEAIRTQIDQLTNSLRHLLERRGVLEGRVMGEWNVTVVPERPPAPDLAAIREGIRQSQGALNEFMARLQTLPPQTTFISTAFAEAWRLQESAMRQAGATAGDIAAARINLLRQEDAERQRLLGNSITLEETLSRRMEELSQARQRGIITETELIRARAMAQSQYVSQLSGGVAQAMQALAQAWPKQKAFAIAAAVASTAQAVTRTYAEWGWPLGIPFAAAQLAAGVAQINTIRSTNPGSAANPPAVGGGAAMDAAPAQPARTMIVQGFDPNTWFTGSFMERLIEQINVEQENGTVLLATARRA